MDSDKPSVAALSQPLTLGMLYDARKLFDVRKNQLIPGKMASDKPSVAALGRPFTLGMLYDARKDQLIPGVTLWDEKTLREKTQESYQNSSNSKVTALDSIEDKSSLLDVNASLKASFLCGLIEVGGSAHYLNDQKKSFNQSRVTLQYKATTVFKQLMMTVDEMKKTLRIDDEMKSLATHVVIGILYGANAFFVFDSEKLDASKAQKIEGSMEAAIKKIPLFSLKGKVKSEMSEEEKAFTDKFSCKFYGDLIPDTNPATFESAVQTYENLPKLLGVKSVPLMVWMMPLTDLDPLSTELKTKICPVLLRKVQDTLEEINKLKIRCDDCLEDSYPFLSIQKRLKQFKELCADTTAKLKETLSKKLPSIRAGKEKDHNEIKKIFDDSEKGPFSTEKLNLWMKNMEREITVIKSCVGMMEGAKIPNEVKFNQEIFDPDKEVLCFVFTSLETTDPFLQKMFDNLDSLDCESTNTDVPTPADPWFVSDQVVAEMRRKAKVFGDIAKVLKNNNSRYRCLVGATENKNIKGASIYQYRNGKLVTEDFSKPYIPNVENITNRGDLIWYAVDLTLDPETAHPEVILSDGNKKATHGEAQQCPDLPQRFDQIPQVLCEEELSGRHYWEVELNTEKGSDVSAGVGYGRMERKGKVKKFNTSIGRNKISWSLGYKWKAKPVFYPSCKKSVTFKSVPQTGFHSLGVYLDHPGGTLSYYIVTGDKLSHIHTFSNKFTEPVYPGFMMRTKDSSVFLRL